MDALIIRDIDFPKRVSEALARIREDIRRTAIEPTARLGEPVGGRVFVKWESEQITGSFKLRGALNKIRSLSPAEKSRGITSASTGNHGLAIGYACRLEKVDLKLFLPATAAAAKRRKIEALGVLPEFAGASSEQAEAHAREVAGRTGRTFVSPYNDLDIIFGAGTVGLEIGEDCPEAGTVVVPVGGGGLIAGIAGHLKGIARGIRVVGVEPETSAFMSASLAAGRLVEVEEGQTVADAVAGGIEPGSVTFSLCRELVDDILTVREASIVEAMTLVCRAHGRVIEGAAALPVAAMLEHPELFRGQSVVAVVSGGNIGPERFAELTGLSPRV